MDIGKKIECSLKIYEDISRQIQFADTKAGLILAWHGATSFFILNTASNKDVTLNSELWLILSLALFFVLVSIIYSISTVVPRIKSPIDTKCMFWIMDISHKGETHTGSVERFQKNIDDENQVFKCISNSVVVVSKILKTKYEYVQRAIGGLLAGMIFEIIFMLMVIAK